MNSTTHTIGMGLANGACSAVLGDEELKVYIAAAFQSERAGTYRDVTTSRRENRFP